MDSLTLAFLPLALWWPVATGLSLLLVLGAVLWVFMQNRPSKRRGASAAPGWLPGAFALLALVLAEKSPAESWLPRRLGAGGKGMELGAFI